MNSALARLHAHAVKTAANYRRAEWRLILVLQEVEKTRLFRSMNCPSLFQYAVKELALSEAVAYSFISVARKALQIPELGQALCGDRISVSKASRIVAGLNHENAEGLIEFARSHSARDVDFEVARLNPRAAVKDRIKPISEDRLEARISLRRSTFAKLERARALEAQKGRNHSDLDGALDSILDDYLRRHDPVLKAERAPKKAVGQNELCTNRVRKPLCAAEKHAVHARDKGRCTHVDAHGARCTSDRWVHIHHIVPMAKGGANHPGNLTTLCSFHHDLVHQQANRLRSPVAADGEYVVSNRDKQKWSVQTWAR